MTNPKGRPIAVSAEPDPDGTQWLTVEVEGVGECQIALGPQIAADVAAKLQQGFLHTEVEGIYPQYAQLTVENVFLGHGEGASALLVDTDQSAALALILSKEMIGRMRAELDRLDGIVSEREHPH